MVLPSNRYSPLVGLSKNPRICSRVDFPDPEGPIMAINSPSCTEKETPRRAWVPSGYPFSMFLSSRRTIVLFSLFGYNHHIPLLQARENFNVPVRTAKSGLHKHFCNLLAL